MLTIFSNQSATFNHPNDYNTKCSVNALDFVSVPDWVADSEMFKALKSMGKIKIIENRKDVADVEIKGKVDESKVEKILEDTPKVAVSGHDFETSVDEDVYAGPVPPAEDDEVEDDEAAEAEASDYDSMTNKELYKLCVEKGIDVEAKMPKKAYLDALNSNK